MASFAAAAGAQVRLEQARGEPSRQQARGEPSRGAGAESAAGRFAPASRVVFAPAAAVPGRAGSTAPSSTAAAGAGARPAGPRRSAPAFRDGPADTGSCRRSPRPVAAPWRTASRGAAATARAAAPSSPAAPPAPAPPAPAPPAPLRLLRVDLRAGGPRPRRQQRAGAIPHHQPLEPLLDPRHPRRRQIHLRPQSTPASPWYGCTPQRAHDHREAVCGKSGFGGIGPGHGVVYRLS